MTGRKRGMQQRIKSGWSGEALVLHLTQSTFIITHSFGTLSFRWFSQAHWIPHAAAAQGWAYGTRQGPCPLVWAAGRRSSRQAPGCPCCQDAFQRNWQLHKCMFWECSNCGKQKIFMREIVTQKSHPAMPDPQPMSHLSNPLMVVVILPASFHPLKLLPQTVSKRSSVWLCHQALNNPPHS